MGVKRLLDKITITDSSNVNNDGNVTFISCVYDEDADVIEVFNKAFEDISTTELGYSGEYFEQDYDQIAVSIASPGHGSGSNQFNDDISFAIFATAENVYTIEFKDSDIGVPSAEEDYQLCTYDISAETASDVRMNSGSGTWNANRGMYVDETNNRMYYVAATSVQAFNLSTGARVSGEDVGSGLVTDARGVWVDEANDKMYIGDNTAQIIYAYDISTPTSPARLASEDIDLSTANASITFTHWSFISGSDRVRVWDTQAYVARSFKVSDQTHQSGEDITPTHPFGETFGGEFASDSELFIIRRINSSLQSFLAFKVSDGTYLNLELPVQSKGSGSPQAFIANNKFCYNSNKTVRILDKTVFPSVLVYPNARDFVNDNIGTYWRRNPTNYIYRDGDNYVYFQPFTSPPYFLKRSALVSESEVTDEDLVDDLEASITSYTYPASKTATDGSITVTATGTHTPFTYQIIGPNNSNESPQASGTFNNLTAGNYSFRIIDDNNVIRDLPPFNLPWVEEVLDDYGVLYDFEWFDVTGTNEFKLEIVKKGYAGSTTTLTNMGDPPFTLSLNPNGSDIVDTHIISLNASVTFVSDTVYDYLEISQGNDEDYAVIFYVHNGASFDEYWRGMISPRSYSETLSGTNHYTTFTATDRIGDLQNLKYRQKIDAAFGSSTYDPDFKSYYGGKKTLFQVLHYCMRQLNMNMGYRIALNLFEDSHNTAASDDPLNQTKVDTDSYFDDNNDMTLQEVVTHIIKPFKAYIVGYDGYWYIIDKENLSSASISYVEYDETGAYVTNSSWSPRIDFGTPSGSNKFRWINDAQVSTTEVYKDILLTLDTKVINKGRLTSEFIGENRIKLSLKNSAPRYLNFKGWNFFLGSGENVDRFIYKSGVRRGLPASSGTIRLINFVGFNPNPVPPDEKYDWVFKQSPEGGGNSRIVYNKKITTGPSDDFELTIKVTSGLNNAFRISGAADEQDLSLDVPYIKLRWKMKVGSYYYNYTTGNWTTTDTTNEFFINSSSEQNFNVTFNTPPVAQSETNYQLTVYPADVTDYDLDGGSTEAAMLTALKAVDTTVLSTGSRLIVRYKSTSGGTDVYIHHYYELQYNIESGSEPDVVDPDDFNSSSNPKRWRLVALKSYLGYDLAEIIGYHTVTYFKDISLRLLPNGSEAPEEANLKWKLDDSNKVTYEETLYHFDPPPNINSAMELFFNHFFTGTRTPTENWSKSGGIDRRIQDHFLRWLAKKLKKTRFVVNGDIHYNTLPTPISVFRDTGDDNALYMMAGGAFDFKQNMITGGTFVEIERDTAVSISSVTSGFDSDGIE